MEGLRRYFWFMAKEKTADFADSADYKKNLRNLRNLRFLSQWAIEDSNF